MDLVSHCSNDVEESVPESLSMAATRSRRRRPNQTPSLYAQEPSSFGSLGIYALSSETSNPEEVSEVDEEPSSDRVYQVERHKREGDIEEAILDQTQSEDPDIEEAQRDYVKEVDKREVGEPQSEQLASHRANAQKRKLRGQKQRQGRASVVNSPPSVGNLEEKICNEVASANAPGINALGACANASNTNAAQVCGTQFSAGTAWKADDTQHAPALALMACVIATMTGAIDRVDPGETGSHAMAKRLAPKRECGPRFLPKSILAGHGRQSRGQVSKGRHCGSGRRGV